MQSIFTKGYRFYLMGLSAIGVVGLHISLVANVHHPLQTVIDFLFSHGGAGVNVFFLLSAYGLCYSYDRNRLSRFYANRVKRIIPMYAIALIASFIIKGKVQLGMISSFIMQLSGLALFTRCEDTFWFMETLILLYLSFPLIMKTILWFYRASRIKMGGVIFYVLLVMACEVPFILSNFNTIISICSDTAILLTIPRIPVIFLGILTYLLEKDNKLNEIYFIYGISAMLSLCGFIKFSYLSIPAIMLLISLSNIGPLSRVFCFFGRHSLEIFLGHVLVLPLLKDVKFEYSIYLPAVLALMAICSLALYYSNKIILSVVEKIKIH